MAEPRERPILFSGEMVRAILDGRKTQTRRVVKPQAPDAGYTLAFCAASTRKENEDKFHWVRLSSDRLNIEQSGEYFTSPYGKPGDRLWVRESFQPLFAAGVQYKDTDWQTGKGYAVRYVSTEGRTEWVNQDDEITDHCKPAIFMPRWASRITLEIAAVRVERLRDISEAEALAEGVQPFFAKYPSIGREQCLTTGELAADAEHRASFACLWDELNADRGFAWIKNPWAWVVSFKRVASATPLHGESDISGDRAAKGDSNGA